MNLRDDPSWPGGWRCWLVTAAAVVLAALLLSGCDRGSPTDPAGASYWRITQGSGALTADGVGWQLEFPQSPRTTNYVQAPYVGGAPAGEFAVTFEVAISPDASWYTPGDGAPAHATLLLESRGGLRMWAGRSRVRLDSPGVIVVSAPLDWRSWTGVYGRSDEAAFDGLLANLGSVGVTFGGANFYGHGVGMAAGAASIRLVSLKVGT